MSGMVEWSGQNWYQRANGYRPTIAVIEAKSESYDEYADRRERERDARRVPFGFSRALVEAPADRSRRPSRGKR